MRTSPVLDELVELLGLEKLEENLFRGQSQALGWGTVFGGQVLGQALRAATTTVPEDRRVHSLHAYFLRPGDDRRPIVYDVDRIRDGGSFTTRRVRAIQAGQIIFNMSASFQRDEEGFDHHDPAPEVPPPESVPTEEEQLQAIAGRLPDFIRDRAFDPRPFEVRPIELLGGDPFAPTPRPPRRRLWFRTAAAVPERPGLHAELLAYASDYSFVTTALLPHGVSWLSPGMVVASIDHAMWFHRPARIDDWLLHDIESPSASGARGLVRGKIFDRAGRLVATTVQEGLIRRRPKPSTS